MLSIQNWNDLMKILYIYGLSDCSILYWDFDSAQIILNYAWCFDANIFEIIIINTIVIVIHEWLQDFIWVLYNRPSTDLWFLAQLKVSPIGTVCDWSKRSRINWNSTIHAIRWFWIFKRWTMGRNFQNQLTRMCTVFNKVLNYEINIEVLFFLFQCNPINISSQLLNIVTCID